MRHRDEQNKLKEELPTLAGWMSGGTRRQIPPYRVEDEEEELERLERSLPEGDVDAVDFMSGRER